MRRFQVSFVATERYVYSIDIEAENPEAAYQTAREHYSDYDWQDQCHLETDSVDDFELVGEWLEDNEDGYFLKRMNIDEEVHEIEPIEEIRGGQNWNEILQRFV